jgi:hypothetical protein
MGLAWFHALTECFKHSPRRIRLIFGVVLAIAVTVLAGGRAFALPAAPLQSHAQTKSAVEAKAGPIISLPRATGISRSIAKKECKSREIRLGPTVILLCASPDATCQYSFPQPLTHARCTLDFVLSGHTQSGFAQTFTRLRNKARG